MLLSLLKQRAAHGALQLRALKYSAGVASDNNPYFHINNLLKNQKWFFLVHVLGQAACRR